MMFKEFLRKNRDYSRLLDGDDAEAPTPRSQNKGRGREGKLDEEDDDVSRERQEYLDRRRRLKELERQKLTKGKNGVYVNGRREKEETKTDDRIRTHGGSTSRGDAGMVPSKNEKKLPYDRSFGSFFGPFQPIVAKRIIEEARAREEAEIVAARAAKSNREEAKASREVEQKKSKVSSSALMSSHGSKPSQRPAKLADKVNEKARKLKEARDYSCLFDDSPLPEPKTLEKKTLASSNLADGRRKSAKAVSVQPDVTHARKPPLAVVSKSGLGVRGPDNMTSSKPTVQSQSKLLQPSRPAPTQATRDRFSDDRSASQTRPKAASSAKPLPTKVSSAGPGQVDRRKEADFRKEAIMRKPVVVSMTSNGSKSRSLERQPMGRRPAQAIDRRSAPVIDKRPAQAMDRQPTAQSSDSRPRAQTSERRAAQSGDRRPVPCQASDRRPVASQGAKRGAPASATYRPAVGGAEPRRQIPASQAGRQSLQPKSAPKGSSRQPSSDYKRGTYSDDRHREEVRRKRARSLSEESDDRPFIKKKVLRANTSRYGGRARSPSEEDDDSFIDDDDDGANVSSMIHNIMGYNPNKYRENDDFDDRLMEVGFHTIQAEERRSAREARLEDEQELALIEAEEREEKLRKAKKKSKLAKK